MIVLTEQKSEKEWKEELSKEEYRVLRKKGTEAPFSGKYWNNKEKGIYRCAGCGNPLFDSGTKFKSGTGWPSFYLPIDQQNVDTKEDLSHNMRRTEVLCSKCKGHLGHVFKDGQQATGLRYCINSISLDFETEK
jgi:peptide-methionine (R)-S-oxide reductase